MRASKRSRNRPQQISQPSEPRLAKGQCIDALKLKAEASTALPNEIWIQVLSYLNNQELKKLRLVGDRHLEHLACSRLFRVAYVAARRGVLDIFMKVTTHPTIRHFIKEVVYDSSWFNPPLGASRTRNGSYRITNACTDLAYAKLFQEQKIIQTRELSRCLKIAFAVLTCVKRVVFADLSRTAGLLGDTPDADGLPLLNRISSGFEIPWGDQTSVQGPKSRTWKSTRGALKRQYDGLFALFRVLSNYAPTTFTELSLGDGRHSSDRINYHQMPSNFVGASFGGIPNWFFTPAPGRSLDKVHSDVFRRLRKLDITICFPGEAKTATPLTCSVTGHCEYLRELLSLADGIEDLRLCGHIDTANLPFSETVPEKTWTRLRNLELRYVEATLSEVQHLFTRHQYSLKSATLDFFNLTDGTWQGLINSVASELPELSLTIGWAWQSGELREVQDARHDGLWHPRKREDRLYDDADESEPERHDETESSSEEELDYSSGSEGLDDGESYP